MLEKTATVHRIRGSKESNWRLYHNMYHNFSRRYHIENNIVFKIYTLPVHLVIIFDA